VIRQVRWAGDHRRVIAAARSFFECYDGWVLSAIAD
jgi:hypothetical protein